MPFRGIRSAGSGHARGYLTAPISRPSMAIGQILPAFPALRQGHLLSCLHERTGAEARLLGTLGSGSRVGRVGPLAVTFGGVANGRPPEPCGRSCHRPHELSNISPPESRVGSAWAYARCVGDLLSQHPGQHATAALPDANFPLPLTLQVVAARIATPAGATGVPKPPAWPRRVRCIVAGR